MNYNILKDGRIVRMNPTDGGLPSNWREPKHWRTKIVKGEEPETDLKATSVSEYLEEVNGE